MNGNAEFVSAKVLSTAEAWKFVIEHDGFATGDIPLDREDLVREDDLVLETFYSAPDGKHYVVLNGGRDTDLIDQLSYLTFQGNALTTNHFGPTWSIASAFRDGDGNLQIVWANSGTDQVATHNMGGDGHFVSGKLLTSDEMRSLEVELGMDLNGDTSIGDHIHFIDQARNYRLFTLNDGPLTGRDFTGAVEFTIKYQGQSVQADQFGSAWVPVALDSTNEGIVLTWSNEQAGLLALWTVDDDGNFESIELFADDYVQFAEMSAGADLDEDGNIGPSGSQTIENIGSTTAYSHDAGYIQVNGSGVSAWLHYNGNPLVTETFGQDWQVVGAEWDGPQDRFNIMFENQTSGDFAYWNADADGNLVNGVLVPVDQVDDFESQFAGQDFNDNAPPNMAMMQSGDLGEPLSSPPVQLQVMDTASAVSVSEGRTVTDEQDDLTDSFEMDFHHATHDLSL